MTPSARSSSSAGSIGLGTGLGICPDCTRGGSVTGTSEPPMLQRQTTADGIVFYASPQLRAAGVPHAFSSRLGGVSRPPFDSMNLGNPNGCDVQDDYENVWANYR